MSYLFQYIPPFAADYSGVASALHDLGGLVVIHDASGCTGSFTGYDEPRWFSGRSSVFCSGLREFDAILGNDARLLDNIRAVAAGKRFNFIAVIGSPVPMLVGFDFDGFARMAEAEFGLPVLGFPMTGLARYEAGLSAAFLAFAERFVREPDARGQGANLLGVSPLDNFDEETVGFLKRLLEKNGLPVVSVWGQGDEWQAMQKAAGAAVNLVAAASAIPLAQALQSRFGIPWVAGLPVGEATTGDLENRIARIVDRPTGPARGADAAPPSPNGNASVFLIGEQLRMNAYRLELARRCPGLDVTVGSFFAWHAPLSQAGDGFIANEAEAILRLASGGYDVVVGDPLLRELMPEALRERFIEEPHYGLSARLYRDHSLSRRRGVELDVFLGEIVSRAGVFGKATIDA